VYQTDLTNLSQIKNESFQKVSNPIKKVGLVAKINALSGKTIVNKETYESYTEKPSMAINYQELIKSFTEIINSQNSIHDLFLSCHKLFTNKLNASFMAWGLINDQANYIDIKSADRVGCVYSSRIFMNETTNEVIKSINSGRISTLNNNSFLKVPYLQEVSSLIIPVASFGKQIGVMVIGDRELENRTDFYNLVATYCGLFINNFELKDRASQNAFIDNLTGLYSHRHFQEILAKELSDAERNNSPVSVVLFDVNDISKINKEFGHAKGDEVIRTVAEKISANIKKQDSAGRYGGDEIAVILPGMSTEEAKYLAEYLTYTLSCCSIDNVGPVRVSVGVASYPEASIEQDKLLILAEQAMCISKSKGDKNGISTIVSSQDYDFWDDTALNSFASVLAKRHAQIGINFEEELVTKFQNEEIRSQNHLLEVVTSLAGAIDAKDTYTKGHSTSVSRYAVALARAVNLPEKEVEKIKLGGLLHDVGKIGIPETVLKKTAGLTDEEWSIMKQHPTIGADKVLKPNPLLHDLIPIVKYHHEQWNGKGYPEGLKGEEIPYAARIVAVADTYHALISDRPYRKGMSVEKACEILKMGAGIQWDADLVRQFIQIAPSLSTMI